MRKKVNFLTIFLTVMILSMGGLSLFIISKIKEEKPATVPTQTKAASITYRKLIALKQPNSTPTSSSISPPTSTPFLSPTSPKISQSESPTPTTELPTPTRIQLVTTPFLTPEPSTIELAYNNLTPTEVEENLTFPGSPTPTSKQIIKNLPQSGIYTTPLLIIFFASTLIFLSFVL
jgi:hypothetical protein